MIKCRAWAKHQNKMYSPEELSADGMTLDMNGRGLVNINGISNKLNEYDDNKNFIVELFIDSKDADGKEIFAGDKVKPITGHFNLYYGCVEDTAIVEMYEGGWFPFADNEDNAPYIGPHEVKIVGNIHEIPEG